LRYSPFDCSERCNSKYAQNVDTIQIENTVINFLYTISLVKHTAVPTKRPSKKLYSELKSSDATKRYEPAAAEVRLKDFTEESGEERLPSTPRHIPRSRAAREVNAKNIVLAATYSEVKSLNKQLFSRAPPKWHPRTVAICLTRTGEGAEKGEGRGRSLYTMCVFQRGGVPDAAGVDLHGPRHRIPPGPRVQVPADASLPSRW
jgi:hypothetical protein